uniref:Prohibitin n=1 Tax=Labrus bergylta TaxID=56723 RepID=A0A3Q3EHE4_9LABR
MLSLLISVRSRLSSVSGRVFLRTPSRPLTTPSTVNRSWFVSPVSSQIFRWSALLRVRPVRWRPTCPSSTRRWQDYDERVLPSIANEVLKSVWPSSTNKRPRELFERAKDFNIILDDVAITELSFSREYTAAVEAKQVVTQQEAQRAQFYVEKAKQDQRHKIIQAEGEAEAAKMLRRLTKNPGYLKLRKIRAAQNIAKTVAQSQNKVYLSADSLVLNLQDRDSFKREGKC